MSEFAAKTSHKEERSAQIIQAALTVFIEKGYRSATTIEIAKAADISEVTLFRYFSSKQEIFQRGIEPILLESLKVVDEADNALLTLSTLSELLRKRIRFLSEHKDVIKLILNERTLAQKDFDYVQRLVTAIQDQLIRLSPLFKEETTIRLLMGAFLSFLYMPGESDQEINDFADRLALVLMSA